MNAANLFNYPSKLSDENKKTLVLAFAIIALMVILFNLIAILGLNTLLHDDPKHYKDAVEGRIYFGAMKFFVLWPFTEFIAWKFMAFSSHLTRGLYVVFLMVPLSWCFYYLYRFKFQLPRLFALTAAVIPNILPHQWQIPAGINMSRTLYPLLIAMFALILGLHYLEKDTRRNWLRLAASAFLYLVCSQMMEQALFLFPPLVLAFLVYTRLNKKHLWLLSFFSIIAAARLIQMLVFTRKVRILAPLEEMLKRTGLYFKFALPSPDITPIYLVIFYVSIILIGFLIYFKHRRVNNSNPWGIYAFFLCWAISTIIPFITMGGIIFPPRYSYISAFGITAAVMFSLFAILNSGFFKKYKLHYVVFAGLIVFSGVYRFTNLKEIFDAKNKTQAIIIKNLAKFDFPKGSQVVITNLPPMAHGRNRASGYLMHALQRNDIRGVFATTAAHEEKNFYDQFNPTGITAGSVFNLHGIYMNQPVFFFALNQEQDKLKQFEYVLRWQGKTRNAPWNIIRADKKTGALSFFRTGAGLEEYSLTIKQLKEQGISRSEILWGGPASEKELKRMNRLELDPDFFQWGFYYYPLQFKKIDPAAAGKFLAISKTLPPLAAAVDFGDGFRLEAVLMEDLENEKGEVINIIHLLWKSLKKQKINKHAVEFTLLKKGEKISRQWLGFHKPHWELEPGDYILGNFKVLAQDWKKADHLGIRLVAGPGSPIGSRLLIPVNQPDHR